MGSNPAEPACLPLRFSLGFVWVVFLFVHGVWGRFWVSFQYGLVLFDTGWPLDGLNGMEYELGFGRNLAHEYRNGEYGEEFRERLTLPFPQHAQGS